MAGGSLVGSLVSSWTGDRVGRRDSMAMACVVFIIGSTLMAAAQNRTMLIVSRVVNGFAVGMLTSQGQVMQTYRCDTRTDMEKAHLHR
jgi:MFS family permease